MKILIIPSVKMKSGTGIRLKGIAKALKNCGYEVEVADNKKEKFFSETDVVFASKALWGSCVPSLYRKIFKRTFTILDIDDLEWSYWSLEWNYWKSILLRNFTFITDIFFPQFFDVITTHTTALKNYIINDLKIPEEKIIFLPQGIDFSMFKKIKWKPSKQKKIVYTAHLGVAALDLDVIFKVFKRILRREKNVTLQIIGSGPFLQYFKDMARKMGISQSVEFLGYVEHKKIPKIISKASVALNYLRDTLANRYRSSIKVREYLAIGIPTVCNVIGDISLFSDYIYGFKTGDVKFFEKKILMALNKPNKKMCRKGRNHIKNHWDWNKVIDGFEKKLRTLN